MYQHLIIRNVSTLKTGQVKQVIKTGDKYYFSHNPLLFGNLFTYIYSIAAEQQSFSTI